MVSYGAPPCMNPGRSWTASIRACRCCRRTATWASVARRPESDGFLAGNSWKFLGKIDGNMMGMIGTWELEGCSFKWTEIHGHWCAAMGVTSVWIGKGWFGAMGVLPVFQGHGATKSFPTIKTGHHRNILWIHGIYSHWTTSVIIVVSDGTKQGQNGMVKDGEIVGWKPKS